MKGNMKLRFSILLLFIFASWLENCCAQDSAQMVFKTEHFDHDPAWEGYRNRIAPQHLAVVNQNFGYSSTHFAGQQNGELGGRVQRCSLPAFYVDKISPRTLNDKLSASGTFAVTAIQGGAGGLFFGWLNSKSLLGNGDADSFGMLMIFEQSGGRISVRLHNSLNQSCGTFVTPYIPGRYRPTPIKPDGTRYHWTLDYDPDANQGNGQFQVCVKQADGKKPADHFEGLVFTVDLPAGFKKQGATFDRFGLTNERKLGGGVNIYFDDLQYDGKSETFSTEPDSWEGMGNRGDFKDQTEPGANDFGFSEKTNFAGGAPGEAGGCFWRTETNSGYYADRIGPLSMDDPLQASGKVVLQAGALDSDMAFGWFNSDKYKAPNAANFLGIHVGGPTRSGHMFCPGYSTASGTREGASKGPVLAPGQVYTWALTYDPKANGGSGSITATLGDEKVTFNLKAKHKLEGASFDRFGFLSIPPGGNLVRIYFDDLTYTASRKAP